MGYLWGVLWGFGQIRAGSDFARPGPTVISDTLRCKSLQGLHTGELKIAARCISKTEESCVAQLDTLMALFPPSSTHVFSFS